MKNVLLAILGESPGVLTELWDQALDHLHPPRNTAPKPLTQLDWQTIL